MERPLSAASSGTAPSTTSGPTQQHRRHASSLKNGLRPSGSNSVSLFVTNLRLLDLDLCPDWPNIRVSSFSNIDARTRIKCTEYALYQLFRLYEPSTAADKLQPFFPPLEPLQSVNLRAALFRCLNELKKGGVLPKDTVLRKTMLDECQGDKFWEICLALSTVVLRKRNREQKRSTHGRSKHALPVAEKIGTTQAVNKTQKESMLPLAIAHRVALSKVLDQKQRKKAAYGRLHELLVEREDDLVQRKVKSQEVARTSKGARPEKLKAVESTIEKNWIGSTDLRDALIDGDTCPKGDGLLVKSFDHLWNEDKNDGRRESGGADVGLLQRLNDKATEQSARLRRWQTFYDRLTASKPPSARSSRPASQAQRAGVTFNRHQDINLNDSSDDSDEPDEPQKPQPRNDSVTRYDDILTAMREELRKNSTAYRSRPTLPPTEPSIHPVKRARTQPVAPMRKLSVAIDASTSAKSTHARSPSQTTVPLRSPMGRRVSLRSRSYEKPKVDSQRQPIPLKSEIFSPLKENRRSSLSPLSANSILPSPAEVPESPARFSNVDGRRELVDGSHSVEYEAKSPASPRDSGLGIRANGIVQDVGALKINTDSSESTSTSDAEGKEQASDLPPSAVRPSLAERTRKSMAFNSLDNINHPNSSESSSPSSIAMEPADVLPEPDENTLNAAAFDRRTSLLDRTRQSMSFAPAPPKSKKSSHNRSRTSVYPINQFDTPKKPRRSTIGIREDERDITPMESLMSPEAEYDSVFKSRPKIALSPVLSPYRADLTSTPPPGGVSVGADE